MTPAELASVLAQTLMAAAIAWAALNPRKVAEFVDDCSDGNVCRLERIEEARWWLQNMQKARVA